MRYRHFEPLGRELSVLVLGTALWTPEERDMAQALTDAWLELGGNAFDTGRHYEPSEQTLAACLGERRDDVVILTKGRVTPQDISVDLYASLAALETDSVEIFMLHRDDPSQPVGPILEELNEHLSAGRIRSFGASNWSTDRLDEAGREAASRGIEGFTSSSAQLSLGEPLEKFWPESLSARDRDSLAWYEQRQLPLLAWSPQGRGFFAGRPDEIAARVFRGEANAERRRRAGELATERGATGTQVALAWVLHQAFPVHAIVGPKTVGELRESVESLALELSENELRWLALEADER